MQNIVWWLKSASKFPISSLLTIDNLAKALHKYYGAEVCPNHDLVSKEERQCYIAAKTLLEFL